MQKPDMFYGAPPHIFEKARELRKEMTDAEELLWRYLKKKQLGGFRFRKQHPVSDFVADFYCHTAKLIIEVDGGYHNLENQKHYDRERTKLLNEFGITVLRFTNEQIENDIKKVIAKIKTSLKANSV
jgi:very-short-patch-repair endonuclease